MTCLRPLLHGAPLLLLLLALPAAAAEGERRLTTIDLAAEGTRPAANDLARATVFAEASGSSPGELAAQINGLVNAALKTAAPYATIKTQSGATHTYPIHAKGNRIDGWRMRSELSLESRDSAALSELLGKLQASMGVANLIMLPASETREKAESEAVIAALAAFRVRASTVADALGKGYRIRHLSINTGGGRPPGPPVMRAAAMAAAESAPLPIEAGETLVRATISGQIELAE